MSSDLPNIAVLLCNLGGPETQEEVRPFLEHLFSDPGILQIRSDFLRKHLAKLIAWLRYRKSQDYYAQIGGGSPLRKLTEAQGRALANVLKERGFVCSVEIAMRCWHPLLETVIPKMIEQHPGDLIVLPLFPQYSYTTSQSIITRIEEILKEQDLTDTKIHWIKSWYDHPKYLLALSQMISEALQGFSAGESVTLLFSAHGIPVRYVKAGDPYEKQTQETVSLIVKELGHLGISCPYRLAYQSKLGPLKWLTPSTEETIDELARSGVKQVLVVPISFVSDHIETLYEIEILYKARANQKGILHFHGLKGLNCNEMFISCLADLVIKAWSKIN